VATTTSPGPSAEERWTSSGFTAAPHQIAGHLFEYGKVGSLVCEEGYFYKPLQVGSRGVRERAFYERLKDCEESCEESCEDTALLLQDLSGFVPTFFGVLEMGGLTYMKMEDVTKGYERPCIIDIKIGYQTWAPSETESHIAKCQRKDKATTTSKLGFKICGMQVFSNESDAYWRATKEWCKTLDVASVKESLAQFFGHPSGSLTAENVCLGPSGIVPKIERLARWCEKQRLYQFYSASLLILYEGNAKTVGDLRIDLKLIDFAHAHKARARDDNFISGLVSLKKTITQIV